MVCGQILPAVMARTGNKMLSVRYAGDRSCKGTEWRQVVLLKYVDVAVSVVVIITTFQMYRHTVFLFPICHKLDQCDSHFFAFFIFIFIYVGSSLSLLSTRTSYVVRYVIVCFV